uniref:Uncharacterized protein n=1 Tax=Glossina austeni TaxID=7395 RepID=A0A1A9USM9_GLOAU
MESHRQYPNYSSMGKRIDLFELHLSDNFTAHGKHVSSDAAKNQLIINSELIAFDTQRLTGREWNDVSGLLQRSEMISKPHVNLVTSQVNKVPAYLNSAQRQASKDVCRSECRAYHSLMNKILLLLL